MKDPAGNGWAEVIRRDTDIPFWWVSGEAHVVPVTAISLGGHTKSTTSKQIGTLISNGKEYRE